MNRRDARAPHTATAIVVEALGEKEARHLYARFAEYNERYFGGELAQALILITQSGSARTLGDYCPRDVHGLESRIRIAPATVKRGLRYAEDVLLHEMIHAWQHEVSGDLEPGYRGHGPVFAGKANEIGEQIGLAPVSPKARGGMPDCAQWPANVRPADYYGPLSRPPSKRRKRVDVEDGDDSEIAQTQRHQRMITAISGELPEMSDEDLHALATAIAREVGRRAGDQPQRPRAVKPAAPAPVATVSESDMLRWFAPCETVAGSRGAC